MKPMELNNKIMAPWFTAAFDYLVDRPLTNGLAKSLSSSPDNFLLFRNNFRETPDAYELEVAVPGMSKKDLQLEVADQVLTVQGRIQQQKTTGWFRKTNQYRHTQVYETFVLPEDADANNIRAKCKNGLLHIRIPKIKYEKPRKVIPVGGVAEPEMKWWQKLIKPFRNLWMKGTGKPKQLKPGL